MSLVVGEPSLRDQKTFKIAAVPKQPGKRVAAAVLRFGRVVVNPIQRRVRVADQPVTLGSRAFDVLLALIERRDRVVSKDELLDAAWPGLVVEEANVQVQVSALRAAIGRDAIATVPGLGYRLTLATDNMESEQPAIDVAIGETAASPLHNLPSHDGGLLGRDADCTALQSTLAAHRLVTIAGPAGIGKTRVALAVATLVRERFSDGVWWVDLASLAASDQVANAAASAAGLQLTPGDTSAALARALRRRACLLVMDNCEHLVDGVAQLVSTLLGAVPGLRVLATSQVPLNLGEEQCFRLEPLASPAAGAAPEVARQSPALALLLRRARAIDRRFGIDDSMLGVAASICRQLDGVPLAIELAAARLPMLGVQALHDMLAQRLALLWHRRADLPPRQHALQAALDWSCGLLSPAELHALQGLSIFAAGFRLDSALSVIGSMPEANALDLLASLVDRSLVHVEQRGPPRYRLLETTRLHAAHGLALSDVADSARARWRAAMAELARACESEFWWLDDETWIGRFLSDQPNLEAAYDECIEQQEVESAGAIGQALHRLDDLRSLGGAVRQRKRSALALAMDPASDPARCAELWNVLSFYAETQVDGVNRTQATERRLEAWRRRGEPGQLYRALGSLAVRRAASGDADDALRLMAEAHALAELTWPPRLLATAAYQTALVHMHLGDAAAYLSHALRMLGLATEARSTQYVVRAKLMLADAHAMAGRYEQAIPMLQSMVGEARALSHPTSELVALAMLCTAQLLSDDIEGARDTAAQAWPLALEQDAAEALLDQAALMAALQGKPELAARLLGFARRPSELTAPVAWTNVARLQETAEFRLQAVLDPARFAGLREQGARLSVAAGLALLEELLAERG